MTTTEAATTRTSGCWAPESTMYFGTDGTVRACCVNQKYLLGRIGEQSLREIWDGARIERMRNALAVENWTLGCQQCGDSADAGNREYTVAAQFDRYAGQEVPDYPRRMDFVLSNTCNLQCVMCEGTLSSSIRAQRERLPPMPKHYDDAFFDELRDFLPHLEQVMFLGGEPFLARESRRVWDMMLELGLQIPGVVVTNGTHWNDRVERYLRELPLDVSISIDGATAATVESIRVGADHGRLMENVRHIQDVVEGRGGTLVLHFCLMPQNWQELGAFLLDADREDRAVTVITVTQPSRYSLFKLDVPELQRVLAGLEREEHDLRPRLDRNRHIWDAEMDRLRRHLASLEIEGAPLWVRSTSRPESRLTADAQRARADGLVAEQTEWAGRPPLALTAVDGVVTEVEQPPWAAPLDPQAWIGAPVESLAARIAETLGPTSEFSVDEVVDGVFTARCTFGTDPAAHLRSISVESQDGEDATTVQLWYFIREAIGAD